MGELYNPYPKLPKNIRQIGERDQIVKLYMEDYVNTYLKRLYPSGGQDLRIGLLLGNVEMHEGTPYIFIDGAMEMEDVVEEGEKVAFHEAAWKKAYQNMEQMFPKRTVQGWFLCGAPGCQLSPLNYWKQHMQYFQGPHKLMYLNAGLEGEESVYITSEDGFYKLRGHSIYYERNQMMQDYMVLRKDARRVESGTTDQVTRDFRQRMEEKKTVVTEKRHTIGMLGSLCTAMSIIILAGGIAMFNNYSKMREMESVIASALPQNQAEKGAPPSQTSQKGDSHIIVEEAAGEVYPAAGGDRETMSATVPSRLDEADAGINQTQAALNDQVSGGDQAGAAGGGQAREDRQAETGKASETRQGAAGNSQNSEADSELTDSGGNRTATGNKESSPAPASAPLVPTGNQQLYTVGEGETLYGICLKVYHDLNHIEEICRLNGLEDANKIVSGQELLLP